MDTEGSLLAIRNAALEALSSLTDMSDKVKGGSVYSDLMKQTMVNAQKNLIAAFCLERYMEEEHKHEMFMAELNKTLVDVNENDFNLLASYERERKTYNQTRDVVYRLSAIVDETNRCSETTAIAFRPIFDRIVEMKRKYDKPFEEYTSASSNNHDDDVLAKFTCIESQHRLWMQAYTEFMQTLVEWDDVSQLEFKVLQMHAKKNDINASFEDLIDQQVRREKLLV